MASETNRGESLNPVSEHLPVENMVYANQQHYYDAISASSAAGQSGPFIDFMLGEIQKTLETHKGEPLQEVPNKVHDKVHDKVPNKLLEAFRDMPEAAWNIYEILNDDGSLTCLELAAQIGVSERMVRKYISLLKANGLIVRIGSNKTGYWKTKR